MSIINYFFEDFYDKKLDTAISDNIIRLQLLIFILMFYGVKLNYNFTWSKYGPFSLELTDDAYKVERRKKKTRPTQDVLKVAEKVKNGKDILKNSKKALLIACYLYLQQRMHGNVSLEDSIIRELTTRKPYLRTLEIQQAISEWNNAIDK